MFGNESVHVVKTSRCLALSLAWPTVNQLIDFFYLSVVSGGGGVRNLGVGGKCGKGVRASISKPTPFIYMPFEKKTDPFIYLIVQNVDKIYCPLTFIPIYCW